jgi:hypothetical protein
MQAGGSLWSPHVLVSAGLALGLRLVALVVRFQQSFIARAVGTYAYLRRE